MPPFVAGCRTAPTDMMEPKIYRPTMEEFKDFKAFVEKIEREDKAYEAGFCKVIPPKEWVPRRAGYNLDDMDYEIQGPIKQSFKTIGDHHRSRHQRQQSTVHSRYKYNFTEEKNCYISIYHLKV